ncbi:MAG: TIGR03936 family radical SAM-associated protein [Bacillota bacterium]
MPRYRIRYTKEGPARFISHLDLLRTFERAVRRAGLPVTLSQGFNPHPRMSFGLPLPVGVAGLSEYVDINLDTEVPLSSIVESLGKSMPEGIRVTGSCPVDEGGAALMAEIERSVYSMHFEPDCVPGGAEKLKSCLDHIMGLPLVTVKRTGKDGRESLFDIRPGLIGFNVLEEDGGLTLMAELITGSALNIRPAEVLGAIREYCGIGGDYAEITRVGLAGKDGKKLFM